MKRCPNCSRVLKKKAWRKPTPADLRKSELFEPFTKEWCDDCMRRGESHNAILQVRGIDLDVVEVLVDKFLDANYDKGIIENGFKKKENFYFSSKSTARKISAELRGWGAELKETNKLVTYDRMGSKPLMRLTIVARFHVIKGDLIETPAGPDIIERAAAGWIWTRGGKKMKTKLAVKIDSEEATGIIISKNPMMITLEKTGETLEIEALDKVDVGQIVKIKSARGKHFIILPTKMS